jgi:hypothetical protein
MGYHKYHILGEEEVGFLLYRSGKAHSRFSGNQRNEPERARLELVAEHLESDTKY